ncbi:hypothetical protein AB0H37_31865, partial [Actinomadura sp. NPDC023710]|uniref:hypothetical protein n=1 Tax=Actinomadura sp. NPDC023710 TaxID=3158219 RepID=UPI0033D403DD
RLTRRSGSRGLEPGFARNRVGLACWWLLWWLGSLRLLVALVAVSLGGRRLGAPTAQKHVRLLHRLGSAGGSLGDQVLAGSNLASLAIALVWLVGGCCGG